MPHVKVPASSRRNRSMSLATPMQLWALNRSGWLALRDESDPEGELLNLQCDKAIKRSIELQGEVQRG